MKRGLTIVREWGGVLQEPRGPGSGRRRGGAVCGVAYTVPYGVPGDIFGVRGYTCWLLRAVEPLVRHFRSEADKTKADSRTDH